MWQNEAGMRYRTVTSKRCWRAVALGAIVVTAIWAAVLLTASLCWWIGVFPGTWCSDDKVMTAAFLSSTVAGGFVMRRRIRWTHSSDVALAAACGVGLGHVALGVALLLLGLSAAAWGLIFIGLPFALIAVPLGVFGATLAT